MSETFGKFTSEKQIPLSANDDPVQKIEVA
jgi:hypothetical protein